MDIRVLKSLTTCALTPYASTPVDTDLETGAGQTDELAGFVVGAGHHDIPFCVGFTMALEIAALITSNPAHVPALDEIIDKARADLRDAKVAA